MTFLDQSSSKMAIHDKKSSSGPVSAVHDGQSDENVQESYDDMSELTTGTPMILNESKHQLTFLPDSKSLLPLSRQKYAAAQEVCKALPDVVYSLSKENASHCLEQLTSLKYHWNRNHHIKLSLIHI